MSHAVPGTATAPAAPRSRALAAPLLPEECSGQNETAAWRDHRGVETRSRRRHEHETACRVSIDRCYDGMYEDYDRYKDKGEGSAGGGKGGVEVLFLVLVI